MKEFLICTVYIETMTSLLKDSAISCYSYHPIPLIFCVSFNRSSTGFWSWVSLDQRDMSSVVQRRWMAGNSGKSYSFSQENLCWLGFIDHLGGGGGSEPLCNSSQSDQLPSLHHQSDEQECRWCHRPGQEERWAPTSLSIWRVLNRSKPSGNIQGWITTMEEHSEAFDLVPLLLSMDKQGRFYELACTAVLQKIKIIIQHQWLNFSWLDSTKLHHGGWAPESGQGNYSEIIYAYSKFGIFEPFRHRCVRWANHSESWYWRLALLEQELGQGRRLHHVPTLESGSHHTGLSQLTAVMVVCCLFVVCITDLIRFSGGAL